MSDVVAGTAGPEALRARKAGRGDLADITDTLALAFHDDPVVTWLIGDESRRRQLLPGFFGAVAESYLGYDEIYAEDEGVSTAVWAPPGAEDDENLPGALEAAVEEHAPRLLEILELMGAKHPVEPLYYLRHGFEVTDEIGLPDGPTMWCMWRSPR